MRWLGAERMRAAALVLILAADRATKLWARTWLAPRFSLPVLPFFHLTYVENTGAAFGIGARKNGLFVAIAAALLAGLYRFQRQWPKDNWWLRYGAVLVAGGALGNVYDRLRYGYVVDFLDFRVWPVFNVADSCVTVGACCLAWGMRKEDRRLRTAAS